MASGGDTHAEARQRRVVGDAIALRGRRQPLDRGLSQSVRVHAMSTVRASRRFRLWTRHFRQLLRKGKRFQDAIYMFSQNS